MVNEVEQAIRTDVREAIPAQFGRGAGDVEGGAGLGVIQRAALADQHHRPVGTRRLSQSEVVELVGFAVLQQRGGVLEIEGVGERFVLHQGGLLIGTRAAGFAIVEQQRIHVALHAAHDIACFNRLRRHAVGDRYLLRRDVRFPGVLMRNRRATDAFAGKHLRGGRHQLAGVAAQLVQLDLDLEQRQAERQGDAVRGPALKRLVGLAGFLIDDVQFVAIAQAIQALRNGDGNIVHHIGNNGVERTAGVRLLILAGCGNGDRQRLAGRQAGGIGHPRVGHGDARLAGRAAAFQASRQRGQAFLEAIILWLERALSRAQHIAAGVEGLAHEFVFTSCQVGHIDDIPATDRLAVKVDLLLGDARGVAGAPSVGAAQRPHPHLHIVGIGRLTGDIDGLGGRFEPVLLQRDRELWHIGLGFGNGCSKGAAAHELTCLAVQLLPHVDFVLALQPW
ncbi:hypothetical protein IGB42_03940 [Andreprevotia sp. IGB-42]|nr:hypothetical protein IGB42_03940 [Andreprevotia sp. IGB-42]